MTETWNYLATHNRARVTLLAIGFLVASVALYFGIGLYALAVDPKVPGDYTRDRYIGLSLIVLAIGIDAGMAWAVAHRGGGVFLRFLLNLFVSIGGAMVVLGFIAARAMLLN